MKLRALMCPLFGILLSLAASTVSSQTQEPANSDTERGFDNPINWGWAITVAAGYDSPYGAYFDDADGGPGFEARFFRAISGNSALRFTIGHSGSGTNDVQYTTPVFNDDFSYGPGQVSLWYYYDSLPSVQIEVYTLTLGVLVRRQIGHIPIDRASAAFSADIGVARHVRSGDIYRIEFGYDLPRIVGDIEGSDSQWLMRLGAGLVFPFGRRSEIETGIDLNLMKVGKTDQVWIHEFNYEPSGRVVRATIGLTIAI